jgi:hypothetical protein
MTNLNRLQGLIWKRSGERSAVESQGRASGPLGAALDIIMVSAAP